jgi:hypothetical protein
MDPGLRRDDKFKGAGMTNSRARPLNCHSDEGQDPSWRTTDSRGSEHGFRHQIPRQAQASPYNVVVN